ncbi:MAG: hypothetical protein ACPGVX_10355, partial [Thalassobaculaceae bacterium]
QTQQTLNEHGERAQALRDELIFLIERGDKVGEKLAVPRAAPDESSPSPARAPEAAPADQFARPAPAADDREDRPRSRAEEDLLRALRGGR